MEESTMNGNGVVLIVDDHAPLARSLVSLFNASGFDAQAVHSGAEALAFVHSHAAVALILLDMSLPDMSGVDVLRAIRGPGGGHSHSLPVVMFSADDDQEIRDELMQLGDFASKASPGGLLRVVSAYVRSTKPPRA
jgi:two-component system, OmpR family, response regulator PrrA